VASSQAIVVVGAEHTRVSLALVPEPKDVAQAPKRGIPWVGIAVTGAFAASAATLGLMTLDAKSSLDAARNRLGASAADIESRADRARATGIAADICLAGAIVSGGVTLYLALRPVKEPAPSAPRAAAPPVRVGFTGDRVVLTGTW
jgi:hypothetical protein